MSKGYTKLLLCKKPLICMFVKDMTKHNALNKNLKWLGLGNIVQIGLSSLYFIFLGILLSVEDFGLYSFAVGLVGVINILLEVRLQDVASKYFWNLNQNLTPIQTQALSKDLSGLYMFDLVLKTMLPCSMPIFVLVYSSYSQLPGNIFISLLIFALGFYFMKVGSQLNLAILRILEKPELLVGSVVFELVIRLILLSAVYLSGNLTFEASLAIFCITGILLNLIQFIFVHILLKKKRILLRLLKLADIKTILKRYRNLLVVNYGVSLSSLMNQDLDVAILPFVMGVEKIAVYKMSKNFAGLIWKLIDPVNLIFLPRASMLMEKKDFKNLKALTIKMMLISFFGALAVNLVLGFIFLIGGSHIESLGYLGLVPVFSVMAVFITICSPLSIGHSLLIVQDKAKLTVYAALVSTISGTIALVFLTKSLGIIGAAIAWGSSLSVVVLAPGMYGYYLLRRRIT